MADPKETARQLVTEWRGLFGDRVRSAMLFGSVARGEAVPGVSDINVMILIDKIDAATLKRASSATRKWMKEARTAPLVFEVEEWRRASDVFAVEIADMKDAHEVLYGDDPVSDALVDEQDLRLQTEHELRGKLLQLQTGLLVAATTPGDVGKLLTHALPSFAAFLRAALRLAGQQAPANTIETFNSAATHIGVNPAAFLRVWEARGRKAAFKIAIDDPLVDLYYATAEKTADFVDNLRR